MRISEISNRTVDGSKESCNTPNMLNESSLSRIITHTQNHACGMLTAYRGDRSRTENQKANNLLVARIQRSGYGATAVMGSYIEQYGSEKAHEVSEHSFFVHNASVDGDDGGALQKFLREQGAEFDQDSVLSIPFGDMARLVGTSHRKESYPPFGVEEVVGRFNGGVVAEFMSRVGNRPFVFREAEEWPTPQTINGLHGQAILAEKKPEDYIPD